MSSLTNSPSETPGMPANTTLIVIRHSPYGSSLAKAALDTALATAAFDRPLQLLFLGDGVLQLMPQQKTQLGEKNIAKQLASLPLYDIESVFVDATAADTYKLDYHASPLQAKPVNEFEMQQLMCDATHLLGF